MTTLRKTLPGVGGIAGDVLAGLTARPKRLPCHLLYDARGSALFEAITELPQYYLTRAERGIFTEHGRDLMAQAGGNLTLIELGAGTASKTRILIDALLRRQLRAVFYPIDVSAAALEVAVRRLNGSFPRLLVRPMVADYSAGLAQLRRLPGRKLVLFIGSSIGNFEPAEAAALLGRIRHQLAPGDAFLLGTDLVKERRLLLDAYNDHQGITAEFNKNLLARINRELGGHFDFERFRHVALWNPVASRIEIYLESLERQRVSIDALALTVHFEPGERIHTENSYKFTIPMARSILREGGFEPETTCYDPHRWFADHLARAT